MAEFNDRFFEVRVQVHFVHLVLDFVERIKIFRLENKARGFLISRVGLLFEEDHAIVAMKRIT